jgi:hypothetical protein
MPWKTNSSTTRDGHVEKAKQIFFSTRKARKIGMAQNGYARINGLKDTLII